VRSGCSQLAIPFARLTELVTTAARLWQTDQPQVVDLA
jgi:hypothetical protein